MMFRVLYPVLCVPIYKEMVWGGSRLQKIYGREIPSIHTGESWDVSCRANEMSVIENGADAGKTLKEWFEADRPGTLGTAAAHLNYFPLLVKIIDARENLSVQVHPSDDNAGEGERGKSEMWYVMQAPEDGELIIGLKDGVTREALRQACADGSAEACLSRLRVKAGSMVNIPAGLVHALTRGVMVAEVQQNSDTTYRLYDYNRMGLDGKPRPLHVEQSLHVADFECKLPKEVTQGSVIENKFFRVEKRTVNGTEKFKTNPQTFTLLTCVEGGCQISCNAGVTPLPLSRTAFIPAGLGEYNVNGHAVLLITTLPM